MNGDGKCSPEHLPHGHRDANGTFGLEAIHALVCNKRLCSIRNYVFIVMACCKRQVKLSQCQYSTTIYTVQTIEHKGELLTHVRVVLTLRSAPRGQ